MAFVPISPFTSGQVLTAAQMNEIGDDMNIVRAAQINVQSVTKTNTTLPYTNPLAANTFSANITGLDVTITPTGSTSKILVIASINMQGEDVAASFRLMRGATAIGIGDAAGSRARVSASVLRDLANTGATLSTTLTHLDNPATTSAVTYGIQFYNLSGVARNIFINRGYTDNDAASALRTASSLTVIEVPV
jgi:hypothetical protein